MTRCLTRAATALLLAASASVTSRAQVNQPRAAGQPPKILNVVHQSLIPGKGSDYTKLLDRIADTYDRGQIPVYWIESQSLTGPYEVMSLNFFGSFAEAEAVGNALVQATASHPALGPMQEQLLGYVSAQTNAIAVRRDDLGYRANTIDFSRTHVLRVATIFVRQGYETEFAEAIRNLSTAYSKLNANAPWVTYQVNAGAPSTTFFILLPMRSLTEMDDYIARIAQLPAAEGDAVANRMQQIARDAYRSWDSEIFIINPDISHVSNEFAEGDPSFWRPRP